MPEPAQASGLLAQLDQLAARGAAHLKRWAWKRAIEGAAPGFFAAALPVPALFALAVALEILSGWALWPFDALGTLGLALAAPLVFVAARSWLVYRRQPAGRRRALALFDRQLGLQDRLQAADEFSRRAATDFQQAAVADAEACAARALSVELAPVPVAAPRLRPGSGRLGCGAAAMLVAGLLFSGYRLELGGGGASADVDPASGEALIAPQPDAQEAEPSPLPAARDAAPAARRPLLAEAAADGADSAEALQRSADSGRQNASADRFGARAGAAAQSQSNQALSTASGEGQPNTQERRPNSAPKRKPSKAQERPAREEQERNESSTGIAGGKGSSSGSKSASSDKQASDNKAQRDEEYDDAYDDLEDEEDEEQQAGSASRPMLSNRKAPVDRSLSPSGTGDQENPDANGRSGPGGLKKTRGVAAMLLGVPLPDHLRGQPNPGRMKVQRERSEPEEKQSPAALAASRGAIDGALGPMAHQRLLPWMRELVRDYFLAERTQARREQGP